jgi:hypothetical protein
MSDKKQSKVELQEYHNKRVAHYSALMNAWISTRTEYTRTIITLSTAGLGVIISLSTSIGLKSYVEFHLFLFTVISFAISIFLGLVSYHLNCKQIEKLYEEKGNINYILKPIKYILNGIFMISIILGTILSIIIIQNKMEM